MRGAATLAAAGLATLWIGCSVDAPNLADRACPCIAGWVCDRDRDVCVRGDEADGGASDAGGDRDAGADGGGDCTSCDDGIACTRDFCLVGGECEHVPDSALCNPSESCSRATGCEVSTCTPPDCDDHDPCTGDTCDIEAATCSHEALCPGELCCPGGGCGACCDAQDCDDADPCTVDACTAVGCSNEPASEGAPCGPGASCCGGACQECCADGDCEDGSACTDNTCVNGACESESICGCVDDADCLGAFCCAGTCRTCCDDADCNDADPCTLDSCENGRCLLRETCPGEECCNGACGECCAPQDCGPAGVCEAGPNCVGNTCSYPPRPDGADCPWGVCCGGGCDDCCEDADCPPPDVECHYHGCVSDVGDHWCQDIPVDDGTECFWDNGTCCGGDCCTGAEICYAWYCLVPPVELESESNDTPADANRLHDGSRVGAQFEPWNDVDWWVITLSAGDVLQVDTSEACTNDTVVFIYAAIPPDPRPDDITCDGSDPDALDCDDDSGDWYCSQLTFVAPADGDYYLRIVDFDYDDTGAYILNVWIE